MVYSRLKRVYVLVLMVVFVGKMIVAAEDQKSEAELHAAEIAKLQTETDVVMAEASQLQCAQQAMSIKQEEENAYKVLEQKKEEDLQRQVAHREFIKDMLARATWFACQNAKSAQDAKLSQETFSEPLKHLEQERVNYFTALVNHDACKETKSFIQQHGDAKATQHNQAELAKLLSADGISVHNCFELSKGNFRARMYEGFIKRLQSVESNEENLALYRQEYVASMTTQEEQEAFNVAWNRVFPVVLAYDDSEKTEA